MKKYILFIASFLIFFPSVHAHAAMSVQAVAANAASSTYTASSGMIMSGTWLNKTNNTGFQVIYEQAITPAGGNNANFELEVTGVGTYQCAINNGATSITTAAPPLGNWVYVGCGHDTTNGILVIWNMDKGGNFIGFATSSVAAGARTGTESYWCIGCNNGTLTLNGGLRQMMVIKSTPSLTGTALSIQNYISNMAFCLNPFACLSNIDQFWPLTGNSGGSNPTNGADMREFVRNLRPTITTPVFQNDPSVTNLVF